MTGTSHFSGPGSQPGEDDGAELQYIELPKAMRTYSAPALPEPRVPKAPGFTERS